MGPRAAVLRVHLGIAFFACLMAMPVATSGLRFVSAVRRLGYVEGQAVILKYVQRMRRLKQIFTINIHSSTEQ